MDARSASQPDEGASMRIAEAACREVKKSEEAESGILADLSLSMFVTHCNGHARAAVKSSKLNAYGGRTLNGIRGGLPKCQSA